MPEKEWVTHHPDPVIREKIQRRWQELHTELERLVRELQKLGAERVVLFGSLAKGTATPGSDIDLLAVIESDLPFAQRMIHFYRLLQPRNADVIIYTPEEYQARVGMTSQALREGQVLYDRSAM